MSYLTRMTELNARSSLTRITELLDRSVRSFSSSPSQHKKETAFELSTRLNTEITGLRQAQRRSAEKQAASLKAQDALSLILEKLQRVRRISQQYHAGVSAPEEKKALQKEVSRISDDISRITMQTQFAGKSLFGEENTAGEQEENEAQEHTQSLSSACEPPSLKSSLKNPDPSAQDPDENQISPQDLCADIEQLMARVEEQRAHFQALDQALLFKPLTKPDRARAEETVALTQNALRSKALLMLHMHAHHAQGPHILALLGQQHD